MKFETKYNVGDKVWLRLKNIESYIKEHPYEEPRKILEACFRKGHVNVVKVETGIFSKEPMTSYIISNNRFNEDDNPEDKMLQTYDRQLYHNEENVFSNFDDVTNMIKETHKNVLNDLKCMSEKILKEYD